MGLWSTIRREWFYTTQLVRMLGALKKITPDSEYLTPDLFEDSVDKHAQRTAFITESGVEISYAQFDRYANRVAQLLRLPVVHQLGIGRVWRRLDDAHDRV